MKTNSWDTYFQSHYQPLHNEWSKNDVIRYEKWYFSWINYIERKCTVFQKRARVFEIGSAVGAVAKILYDRGHDVTGSDISPLMVRKARELCKPIPFVFCDIQKDIPVRGKFDVIMGFEVLEHVSDLESALRSIKKSLRAGGYFVGTSPYPYPKNFLDKTHVNVKYPNEWKLFFRKQGFREVAVSPMSFLPYFWRVSKYANLVIPVAISWPYFVSTTLIIARM